MGVGEEALSSSVIMRSLKTFSLGIARTMYERRELFDKHTGLFETESRSIPSNPARSKEICDSKVQKVDDYSR